MRACRRACSHVERTRGDGCVVSRRLRTGAQRETSAAQRRRAVPLHGSTPRHGDGGTAAVWRRAATDAPRPPPHAATAAPATMTTIRSSPCFIGLPEPPCQPRSASVAQEMAHAGARASLDARRTQRRPDTSHGRPWLPSPPAHRGSRSRRPTTRPQRSDCERCRGTAPLGPPPLALHTAFEDQVCWLAVNCSKSAVAALMRIAWRSVGGICQRVAAEAQREVDLLDGWAGSASMK
jgi:hypothetical protein